MEPNTAQSSGGIQNSQLDPSVVALTKSIGKAESGGKYNASDNTGDGANSSGAYQMTPGFLSKWAPRAGLQYQPGSQLSPEQQDKVAYTAVQTMGTQGDPAHPHLGKLTPAQIASAWNTGDPNAYLDPEYGKNNTYGSTEKYVNKVSQYYDEYTGGKNGSSASNPLVNTAEAASGAPGGGDPSSPDLMTILGGLGLGAVGWLGSHLGDYAKEAIPAVATDALIGEGVGGPYGALAGAGAGLVQPLVKDAIGGLVGGSPSSESPSGPPPSDVAPQNQPDLGSAAPQPAAVSDVIKNALNETLQGTQSNRVFSDSKPGQEAVNTAATFGLISPDENGYLMYDQEKGKKLLGDVGNLQDKVIAANGGVASPLSVIQYAGHFIQGDRFATAVERQKAIQDVQEEVKARGPSGQVSLSDMREAQKQHYAAAKNGYRGGRTTSQILAHKALGNAYGQVIRENMKNPELYDRTKKMEQNLINAREVGKRLNGKKPPKNTAMWQSFLKGSARYAEIYIGDKLGGPLGAILGAMAGEHINRAIDKKYGKTIFETKDMKAAMDILHDTKPAVYTKLLEELKKAGVDINPPEITDDGSKPIEGLIKDTKTSGTNPVEMDRAVNKIMNKKGLVKAPDRMHLQYHKKVPSITISRREQQYKKL